MCKNFNGSHSGGSSFVNVNDCWLLQKLFVYHRYKFSLKKKKIRSPSIWFRTLKPVRIRQSGRTGIRGLTPVERVVSEMSLGRKLQYGCSKGASSTQLHSFHAAA